MHKKPDVNDPDGDPIEVKFLSIDEDHMNRFILHGCKDYEIGVDENNQTIYEQLYFFPEKRNK